MYFTLFQKMERNWKIKVEDQEESSGKTLIVLPRLFYPEWPTTAWLGVDPK